MDGQKQKKQEVDPAEMLAGEIEKKDFRSSVMRAVEKEAPAVISHAEGLQVRNEIEKTQAVEFLGEVKRRKKIVDDEREKVVPYLYRAWKNATALFKRATDPLDEAERIAKSKVSAYITEQDEKRRREEEKARAKALEKERKAKERMNARAEKLAEAGLHEQAEAVKAQSEEYFVQTPIVEAESNVTEVNGIRATGKTEIQIHITNELEFIKAVASGQVPLLKAIKIQVGPIKSYVKLQDTPGNKTEIPGIRIERKKGVSISV